MLMYYLLSWVNGEKYFKECLITSGWLSNSRRENEMYNGKRKEMWIWVEGINKCAILDNSILDGIKVEWRDERDGRDEGWDNS